MNRDPSPTRFTNSKWQVLVTAKLPPLRSSRTRCAPQQPSALALDDRQTAARWLFVVSPPSCPKRAQEDTRAPTDGSEKIQRRPKNFLGDCGTGLYHSPPWSKEVIKESRDPSPGLGCPQSWEKQGPVEVRSHPKVPSSRHIDRHRGAWGR